MVARRLGLSPAAVSILEEKALVHLRSSLRRDSNDGATLAAVLADHGVAIPVQAQTIGSEIVLWPKSPLNGGELPQLPSMKSWARTAARGSHTGAINGLKPSFSEMAGRSSYISTHRRRERAKTRGSSRFFGVSFFKRDGTWKATIHVDGKRRHLGYFATEEDAAKRYDAEALIYGGHLNFPSEAAAQCTEQSPDEVLAASPLSPLPQPSRTSYRMRQMTKNELAFLHKKLSPLEHSLRSTSVDIAWPASPMSNADLDEDVDSISPLVLGKDDENRAYLLGRGLLTAVRTPSSKKESLHMLRSPAQNTPTEDASSYDAANKEPRLGKCTSRYVGVSWNLRRFKWEAQIVVSAPRHCTLHI